MEQAEMQSIKEDLQEDFKNASNLLNEALFKLYPLIILGNLTKNTYYLLTYEDFSSTKCAAAGTFDDLIESGASTMHDMDKELFRNTFCRENLLKEFNAGTDRVEIRVFQHGDDGKLRKVEIVDFFVRSEDTDDALVISFNRNI